MCSIPLLLSSHQSPHAIRVPAFIAAIREDGEIIAKSIIPIPVPHSADIPVPAEVISKYSLKE